MFACVLWASAEPLRRGSSPVCWTLACVVCVRDERNEYIILPASVVLLGRSSLVCAVAVGVVALGRRRVNADEVCASQLRPRLS